VNLKEVFVKHGMCSIEGFDLKESIFGLGTDDKMNICNNHLKSAFPSIVYEDNLPQINLSEFARDAKKALEDAKIKNLRGLYKIYMDDGDVLVVEGGKITFF
jgi:hypothetical protein